MKTKPLYQPLPVDFKRLAEEVTFQAVGAVQGFQSLIFACEAIAGGDGERFKRTLETLHFAAANPLMAACAAGLESLAQNLIVEGREYGLDSAAAIQMATLLTTLVQVMRGE